MEIIGPFDDKNWCSMLFPLLINQTIVNITTKTKKIKAKIISLSTDSIDVQVLDTEDNMVSGETYKFQELVTLTSI